MARQAQDYADQLARLLPPGAAFTRERESSFGALLLALGDELARIDARGLVLIEEADPRTTDEMLGDWERVAGLPDPLFPPPVGLADRRTALVDRLVSRGDITAPGFLALALRQGWSVSIVTHRPFYAGVACAGDPVYTETSRFWWEMHVTVPPLTPTPIELLEASVRRLTPDHTVVTFAYVPSA